MSSSSHNKMNPYENRPYSDNYYRLLDERQELPVFKKMPAIIAKIKANNVLILVGETGSGKTTQVPPEVLKLVKSGMKVAVTQNRRIAVDLVRHLSLLKR